MVRGFGTKGAEKKGPRGGSVQGLPGRCSPGLQICSILNPNLGMKKRFVGSGGRQRAGFVGVTRWTLAMREYENTKSGLHSERCFLNFQLELARSFLKETFYYPHNVDFRGRAYPIPPQQGMHQSR